MNTQQAISKIAAKESQYGAKFVTKEGKLSKVVKNALNCFYGTEKGLKDLKFYPIEYKGRGKYIRKVDNTYAVEQVLNRLGYKYTKGNDAPRGGQAGNYIKVSKTALTTVINLINY